MKRILSCTAILFLYSVVSLSQSKIVADISNLRNDKGVCRACLFNNPASFDGQTGEPLKCIAVPVKNETAEAVFNNVPPGTYAMFVFHDANGNNTMDRNFIGIPKEGYGASKNRLPFAGAPTYSANEFFVLNKTIVRLQIKIRNL